MSAGTPHQAKAEGEAPSVWRLYEYQREQPEPKDQKYTSAETAGIRQKWKRTQCPESSSRVPSLSSETAAVMLDKVNVGRVITSNDHIIHIEEKKSPAPGRGVNKQSRVMLAGLKTSGGNSSAEALKPGPRSLFETVEGTTQPTDQARRSSKT